MNNKVTKEPSGGGLNRHLWSAAYMPLQRGYVFDARLRLAVRMLKRAKARVPIALPAKVRLGLASLLCFFVV